MSRGNIARILGHNTRPRCARPSASSSVSASFRRSWPRLRFARWAISRRSFSRRPTSRFLRGLLSRSRRVPWSTSRFRVRGTGPPSSTLKPPNGHPGDARPAAGRGRQEVLEAHTATCSRAASSGPTDVSSDSKPIPIPCGSASRPTRSASIALDCRPCGQYADLKSNELVFTVSYQTNANRPGVMFNTKIRFTIGATGMWKHHPRRRLRRGRGGASPGSYCAAANASRLRRRERPILNNEPMRRASGQSASRHACSRRYATTRPVASR